MGHFVIDLPGGSYYMDTLRNSKAPAPKPDTLDWAAWPVAKMRGEPLCDYLVRWNTTGGELPGPVGVGRRYVHLSRAGGACRASVQPECAPPTKRGSCSVGQPACNLQWSCALPGLAGATPSSCGATADGGEITVPFTAEYACLQCD